MAQGQIWKPKHTLIGKSLIPINAKVKAADLRLVELARLKKEYSLEDYTFTELRSDLRN